MGINMKKLWMIYPLLLAVIFLSACGSLQNKPDLTTATPTVSSPMENTLSAESMVALIHPLVERNMECVEHIFYYGTLSANTQEQLAGMDAYAVQSEDFPSYTALLQFLQQTYVSPVVDDLMNMRTGDSQYPLYFEHENTLYINTAMRPQLDSELDWTDYTIAIQSTSALSCDFTVGLRNKQTDTELSISMNAVFEDGTWLLSSVYTGEEE